MLKRGTFIFACLILVSFFSCGRNGHPSDMSDSQIISQLDSLQRLGDRFRNESSFMEAIAVHDSCIKLAASVNDTVQLVIALNNQGTNYRRLSAMKEASDYHYRALSICDMYSDTASYDAKKNRVRSLNGLGNIFLSLGNLETAELMFRQALDGERKLGSATGQAINLANIGSIKSAQGEIDSARIYYKVSLEKNKIDSNAVGISLCYTYLGEIDMKDGRLDDALNNFRQSYLISKTTGDTWHWLTSCISLSALYVDNGETDSAAKYIQLGIDAATGIHSDEHLRDLYSLRSKLSEYQGNIKLALEDLKLFRAYNDSVLSYEARNSVQNVRVNYEANRRNIEVKHAEDDAQANKMIRNVVIVIAVLVILLIVIIFVSLQHSRNLKRKAEEEREVFYRNVTHQLRTPMTVVIGMVEQLKDHIPESDVVGTESINAAKRQSKNLLELIQKLIAVSKDSKHDFLSRRGDLLNNSQNTNTEKTNTLIDSPNYADTEENKHILIAEDTDDVALMMATLLREHGYVVRRASDGQEALEMLQQELPDLLLTDIAMPRMDGLELMRHVRMDDTMCHLPIIVASARVEDRERLDGISAGAEVYLTKPFIPEELLLRVGKILEQRERIRNFFSQNTKPEISEIQQFSDSEQEFLNALNKCIDDNMGSGDVSTNVIADNLCVSASTLNRKIKNITGMPTATYVRNRRILVAEQLLTTTDKQIAEIECLCGFNTPGHFSRLLKSETGLSPTEFRQKNRK